MTNKPKDILYTGVTSNLLQRSYQHREKLIDGFSRKYGLTRLVYYELHSDMETAILYEKKLKNRSREWKINLIESVNPEWEDLYAAITEAGP